MFAKYRCLIVSAPFAWYYLGTLDKKNIKDISFSCGLALSQKYKQYPAWDNCVEPLVVKQFAIIDCAAHSFIKGMVSDNDDKSLVNDVDGLGMDMKIDVLIDKNKE